MRFRIIRYYDDGRARYKAQRKGWWFWHDLSSGCDSMREAEEFVDRYLKDRQPRAVVRQFTR